MNNNEIKKILEELYAVDGTLRSRERELIVLIESLAAKPHVQRDQEFFNDLRARLLVELSRTQKNKMTITMILTKNMRYVAAGFAVLVVAGLLAFQFLPAKHSSNTNSLLGVNITKVGDNAFGPLSSLSAQSPAPENKTGGTSNAQTTASPIAAAPTAINSSARPMMAAMGTTMAPNPVAISAPIMAPPAIHYIYKGGTFTQDQASVDVLKKKTGGISFGDVNSALGQSGLGLVDMSSFPGSQVTNLTFTQDQNFGYITNIDLSSGDISISMNWATWPQNNNLKPLTASDMPATSTVITTANKFLADHHIPMANYGDPEVINNFYEVVPLAADAAGTRKSVTAPTPVNGVMRPYYPDSMQVLYPLLLNGKTVYANGGSKIGLSVEVNIRYNKVANVYGLNTQDYQASSYAAITDVNKLISLATNPQSSPVIYYGMAQGGSGNVQSNNVTEIDLGTPTSGYEQLYQYDNATGMSSQFLVPALVFPVINRSGSSTYYNSTNAVVVPLVQDFLENNAPVHILNSGTKAVPPVPAIAPTAPASK